MSFLRQVFCCERHKHPETSVGRTDAYKWNTAPLPNKVSLKWRESHYAEGLPAPLLHKRLCSTIVWEDSKIFAYWWQHSLLQRDSYLCQGSVRGRNLCPRTDPWQKQEDTKIQGGEGPPSSHVGFKEGSEGAADSPGWDAKRVFKQSQEPGNTAKLALEKFLIGDSTLYCKGIPQLQLWRNLPTARFLHGGSCGISTKRKARNAQISTGKNPLRSPLILQSFIHAVTSSF